MNGCRATFRAVLGAGLLSLSVPGFGQGIEILSSRPDMVSGGDALLAIDIAETERTAPIKVLVDGKDVTKKFSRSGERLVGVVDGLKIGRNEVKVSGMGSARTLVLTNYDRNGPIISGPHQLPFMCQTHQFRMPDGSMLGPATDRNCNVNTRVDYAYKSAETGKFKPFSPGAPRPEDLAKTTTLDGHIVDYIVRVRTGTVNRAIYQYAVLFDPASEPSPAPHATYEGWNRKAVYLFGGSAAAGYQQGKGLGTRWTILEDEMLSRGFAVLGSSLNVLGHASSDVLSAETASMVKELFIEEFGVPIYMMGWGGSGGAMSQYLIANNYPGLLDGINPAASFPDLHSVVPGAEDCALLSRAFDGGTSKWSDAEKTAAAGYASWDVCKSWNAIYAPHWMRPDQMVNKPFVSEFGEYDTSNCPRVLPRELTYDRRSNPTGARCDIYTGILNLVGVNPETGNAARGFDNVGVVYGLMAFQSGAISSEQFVELNELVGGYGPEGDYQAGRTEADRIALDRLYRYGRINEGVNLDIPIIDFRSEPFKTPDVHDSVRSLSMRARLIRSRGTADNQIILRSDAPPTVAGTGSTSGAPKMDVYALLQMDAWLSAIKKDRRPYPSTGAKTLANKPSGLGDACFLEDGTRIEETAAIGAVGVCGRLMPYSSNPRMIAGEPITNDFLKCQLKPMERQEFQQLSDREFQRLKKVFATGICDYAKPPVEMRPLEAPWLGYPEPGSARPAN